MDPNLEKIRDYHVEDIKAGKITKPIQEAKNYLMHIARGKVEDLQVEWHLFTDHIKEMRDGQ